MQHESTAESIERARQWFTARHGKLNHYINGAWVGPSSAQFIETASPVDGGIMVRMADGTAKDTDRAVAAARTAQPAWASLDGRERADFLEDIARGLAQKGSLLSALTSLSGDGPENRAPEACALQMARLFEIHAGVARAAGCSRDDRGLTGALGMIIPNDYPLQESTMKLVPALAVGDTVVLKPAGFAAAVWVLLAAVCHECGLPAGVFNLLLGDHKAADLLGAHPELQNQWAPFGH